jgi:hypothetical protein
MKTYWGVEVQLHAFLTSVLDGGMWSASQPGCFTPGERTLGTHQIEGWMGPRASLAAVAKRKTPSPYCKLNPDHPAHSLVAIPTELLEIISINSHNYSTKGITQILTDSVVQGLLPSGIDIYSAHQ